MPPTIEDIRGRVEATSPGRDPDGSYSTFRVRGEAHVGDIGGSWYGDIDIPFEAIAIGGVTHSSYDDNVVALVPAIQEHAEANAEFFAHARTDILFLLSEVERLRRSR